MRADHATPSFAERIDLDLVEKGLVASFMALLALRLVPQAIATLSAPILLLLLSESVVVLFILLRRPTRDISRRPADWTLGVAGTLLPLTAIAPEGAPLAPLAVCAGLMGGGFLFQLWAKLTLRRSFGVVAANRGVKASGPYRLIRHPMYAGYALTHVGFLLSGPAWWNLAVYGATLAIAVRRILAEERVLMADPAYRALAEKSRYRLLPLVF
ncbi:methyltransferase family protein [Sphingosinicella sp.]|uniref:methyltransferase family protein n=1 Tax=Sphingosinicella sp. TaxID=1917971 RepID=UPI0040384D83